MQSKSQPDHRSNNRMRRILEVYYRGGADRVRAMLRRNAISDAKIESILAHLQQNFPDLPIKGTATGTNVQPPPPSVYVATRGKSFDPPDSIYKFMLHDASQPHRPKALMTAAFFGEMAAIVRNKQGLLAEDNSYKISFFDFARAMTAWKDQQSKNTKKRP